MTRIPKITEVRKSLHEVVDLVRDQDPVRDPNHRPKKEDEIDRALLETDSVKEGPEPGQDQDRTVREEVVEEVVEDPIGTLTINQPMTVSVFMWPIWTVRLASVTSRNCLESTGPSRRSGWQDPFLASLSSSLDTEKTPKRPKGRSMEPKSVAAVFASPSPGLELEAVDVVALILACVVISVESAAIFHEIVPTRNGATSGLRVQDGLEMKDEDPVFDEAEEKS